MNEDKDDKMDIITEDFAVAGSVLYIFFKCFFKIAVFYFLQKGNLSSTKLFQNMITHSEQKTESNLHMLFEELLILQHVVQLLVFSDIQHGLALNV